ncbi:MAG: ammonium transporter [Thermoguttaceae bacterium]|nr:ammonium transporter [Thermoguttaceae bacterium]MDW8039256.1 ammonium transporter [Thermoguttaceae bacterium]
MGVAYGQETHSEPIDKLLSNALVAVDTVWVLIAAFLVFFMQAGFGMVEAGLIRAKNTCNILMKNWLDYCVASIMFFLIGYGLMFGQGNGLIGWGGFAMQDASNPSSVPLWAFWLFQAAFCGAAATIVAGGMAERMKFPAYLAYTAVVSSVVYPIIGHWIWGGGWLSKLGFFDFAGSTVVHSTGGWIALVGTMMLGPRIGKFIKVNGNCRVAAIPGHNIPLATLGVFLLWFGWFGFNPGSTLGVSTEAQRNTAALVAANTNLAAAAGIITAMIAVWLLYGKSDLSITMNGALAGLVAITAPCAVVSPTASILIGGVAGLIVVFGVKLLDLLRIDDPVGAVPVHGMNGLWGTLAVGLWGQKELGLARDGLFISGQFTQLAVQALGCLTASLFAICSMAVVFWLIQMIIGLRVSREEELRGLDIEEHGMEAYAGFQIFITQ